MTRRTFLKNTLFGLGALAGSHLLHLSALAQNGDEPEDSALEVTGLIRDVHDPVMIKQDDTYYIYCTGVGIPMRSSTDMLAWKYARGGTVMQRFPVEAYLYVPNATNLWAPDISFYNDRYHLYYAISTFGSNHSGIGLLTNKTLHYDDDDYEWEDQGLVITSDYSDNFNCIDPNLVLDTDGEPWLAFGSYWDGIKMIRLDFETGKRSAEDDTIYPIASRRIHPRAIEAPFIIHRNDYYYLFVSFDQCCNGIQSTYNVRVGRAEEITGPYEDADGVPMMEDGGTQILFPTDRWRGPGHNGIFSEDDQDYIVYHSYDARQGGIPTLRINPLEYDEDGWPFVPGMVPQEE